MAFLATLPLPYGNHLIRWIINSHQHRATVRTAEAQAVHRSGKVAGPDYRDRGQRNRVPYSNVWLVCTNTHKKTSKNSPKILNTKPNNKIFVWLVTRLTSASVRLCPAHWPVATSSLFGWMQMLQSNNKFMMIDSWSKWEMKIVEFRFYLACANLFTSSVWPV